LPSTAERAFPVVADQYGGGAPVLLLHGQPGSATDWGRVSPLLEREFFVVVPDRPGYGRTGGPALGFMGNAAAMVELLDRLEVERVIAVGHSWGGGVAIALAEAYPERVTGLVLAASIAPGETVGWDDRLLAAPYVGEALSWLTIGATGLLLGSDRVQHLADERLAGRALEAVKALTRLTGARTGSRVWRSFVTEQRALLAELDNLAGGLSAIDVPAVVISGTADRVVPARVADILSAGLPSSSRRVLEGAHHLIPYDHPETVSAAVREVAERASDPGRR
jgi:pimeloyl-ACP methyl ester carboxylesterase